MKHKKVKANKKYLFDPVMFDVLNPPFGAKKGDVVSPTKLPGCPGIGVMGMCHIKKDGKFAGMVCVNSLKEMN